MLHFFWWYIGISLVLGIGTYFLIGYIEPGLGQLLGLALLPFINIYSFFHLIGFGIWWIFKGRFEKSIREEYDLLKMKKVE